MLAENQTAPELIVNLFDQAHEWNHREAHLVTGEILALLVLAKQPPGDLVFRLNRRLHMLGTVQRVIRRRRCRASAF